MVATAAALVTAPVLAAPPVEVANRVFVERPAAAGARVLEPARTLRRGDKLVYVVSWKAPQAERFTITNPLPRTVAYQRGGSGAEEVSVDGGRSWGLLEALRVRDGGRWRSATPEDVTHIRWQVPAQLAMAGSGRMSWSGIVR